MSPMHSRCNEALQSVFQGKGEPVARHKIHHYRTNNRYQRMILLNVDQRLERGAYMDWIEADEELEVTLLTEDWSENNDGFVDLLELEDEELE